MDVINQRIPRSMECQRFVVLFVVAVVQFQKMKFIALSIIGCAAAVNAYNGHSPPPAKCFVLAIFM